MNREDAMKSFFEEQMETTLYYRVAAKCAQPCMTNMESPSVSQAESDCLTNCTSKGMETYVWFKYLSLAQPQWGRDDPTKLEGDTNPLLQKSKNGRQKQGGLFSFVRDVI